jgi:SAM-dependent methyltransferase
MEEQNLTGFYSAIYDKLYQLGYHSNPTYCHSYGVIEYLMRNCEFESILDVGSSIGAAVHMLTARGKNALGLEASLEAVNIANRYNRPVLWGTATRLPFANNNVDVVMSTDMMEHLKPEDVDKAVSEALRVARKYIAMKISSVNEQAGWGMKVGVPNLHLTVKPIEWWIEKFTKGGAQLQFHSKDMFILNLGNGDNSN